MSSGEVYLYLSFGTDAVNIAIAKGVAAPLATFDEKMAANARSRGMPLAVL